MEELIYYKLNERYSRELIHFVYMNFFLNLRVVVKDVLEHHKPAIYITELGHIFFSTPKIQRKINARIANNYKDDMDDLLKIKEISLLYPTNKRIYGRTNTPQLGDSNNEG